MMVVFPDVEATVRIWLEDVLPSYGLTHKVHTRVPNPRPAKFIRIQRTGGPSTNVVVDGAQVTFEVWDNSSAAAAKDAQTVRAVLNATRNVRTPSGDLIYRVDEFSGPSLLPDASDQHRYSWTVRMHMRGEPA
jgi:hypothetical protein